MGSTIGISAFLMLFLGIPLWMIFLLLAFVGLGVQGTSTEVVVQQLIGSVNKLILLAVPGFIFAGEVMGRGGMTERLIRWVRALTGPITGGMPITTLGAVTLFSAISGSSTACTAAMGKMLYPGLRKAGYSEKFSLGLLTSTGAIDSIIPPSITMVLYTAVTGASLGRLFLAGFLPGILLGVMISAYSVWVSWREGILPTGAWDRAEIWRTTKDASWTLGAPVLIFGGIYGGLFTPTEAAAIACVYTVIVTMLVYRELDFKGLWAVAKDSAQLTAKVFIITATAGAFSWWLTAEKIPQTLVATVSAANLQPWMVLLVVNIVLLIAGMLIDPASAILVLTPILWPVVRAAGVDDVHFGLIMTLNMAIGMFSPPFGLNLFVASSIFRVPMDRIIAGLWPFAVCYLIGLGMVTYMPGLFMWLPNLLIK